MGRGRNKASNNVGAVRYDVFGNPIGERANVATEQPTPTYPSLGLLTPAGVTDGTKAAGFHAAESFRSIFGGLPLGAGDPIDAENALGPKELDKTVVQRTTSRNAGETVPAEDLMIPLRTTTFDRQPASAEDITWSNGVQKNGRSRAINAMDVYGTVTMLASLDKRFGNLISRPTGRGLYFNPNTSVLRQLSLDLADAIHLDGTVNQERLRAVAERYKSPELQRALKQEMTHVARAISYYATEYGNANAFANRNAARLRDDAKKVRAISLESMIDGLFE